MVSTDKEWNICDVKLEHDATLALSGKWLVKNMPAAVGFFLLFWKYLI